MGRAPESTWGTYVARVVDVRVPTGYSFPWTYSWPLSEIDRQCRNNGVRPNHDGNTSSHCTQAGYLSARTRVWYRFFPRPREDQPRLPKEKAIGTWKGESELDGRKQIFLEVRITNAREYFECIFEVYMRRSKNGRTCNHVVSMVHGIEHPFKADVPVATPPLFSSPYIIPMVLVV